ncbi:N-acetylglucosamine transport system substrate-binding protein [Stackebrandtia albiflava]|uniref:N-acetylglucosamine transport system substrate-binding protein n=1 Tax=Stackebrandtia albiflava TaxID=406432 RepID=A0A562VBR4_9ACTN|nr:N-acetylglucosamine/diacetylchitobiose ABC transporter substrate-binding protein [Stackebrandtia albiflava]TWJ15325.1 N-acetylglucosamine transport system substrate-binding protein [Stackebrandtia albiflava]
MTYTPSAAMRRMRRRTLMKAGALAGLGAGASTFLAACGGAEAAEENRYLRGPVELDYGNPDNPFGVNGDVPLDVTIFKGGYSDEYATKGHQVIYGNKYPYAEIIHVGTEQISEVVKPRFRSYNPPDVLMNAGGERMEMDQLVNDGQLTDLRVLLDAPSIDDPAKTVAETLRDGVVEAGRLGTGDEVWGLPYDFAGYGLWYSQRLFDEYGWQVPQTWFEFMTVCEQIKADGVAPFTYQGRFPYYMMDPIVTLAVKHGGRGVMEGFDEDWGPDAWDHDSVRLAAEAWEEFIGKGFLLEGTVSMSHLEAQDAWIAGDAAFLPCGSWLENEEKNDLPGDYQMKFLPIPPLDGSAEPELVQGTPGEHFVVPRYANNPAGGLEYLRIMLSEAGTTAWVNNTSSLNVVSGATVETDRSGVQSLAPFLADDANLYQNTIEVEHGTFVQEVLFPQITALMRGDASASDFIRAVKAQL